MPHVRRFGFSGLFVVVLIILMIFGINPVTVLTGQVAEPNPHTTLTALAAIEAGEGTPEDLVGAVDREADGFWDRAFRQASIRYPAVEVKQVPSARDFGCGMAGSSLGVFYCPSEAVIYVDMASYADLVARFPAQGHKAEGYLIARAFGHHVQHALRLWQSALAPVPADQPNLQMQAACYAGAWTKWAGLEKLLDDPQMVAAIASRDGDGLTPAPSRTEDPIPETYAKPDLASIRESFDAGYAIPAAGSCRLEKLLAPA